MKTRKTLTAMFATGALATLQAQATLIAYEGFDTTNAIASDASATGVTGSGFSGYGNTNFRMDLEAGLSYTDGSGNTLVSTGRSAGMDTAVGGTQNLQLALNSTITNSGTVYMSFLIDITAVTSFGVNGGLQDSEVGNSSSPTSANEAIFRSTSTNLGIYADGTGIDERTGPSTGTGLYFFVAELNMDTETMTGYLNPTDLTNIAGTATHTISESATSTWGDMSHFIFSLGGQEAGTIDEIRIGTTLADVAPIPEPSSTALLGLGGLALLLRRKK